MTLLTKTQRRRGARAALAWLLPASAALAAAQPATPPARLSGTLAKARGTGSVIVGYRDASIAALAPIRTSDPKELQRSYWQCCNPRYRPPA